MEPESLPLPGDRSIALYCGDCIATMAAMEAEQFDACVTDPPYHLTSIVRRFGAEDSKAPISATQRRFAQTGAAMSLGPDGQPTPDQYGRLSRGFMGKIWDGGDIAFQPETWAAVGRVLKPGAHLVAFAAPKNAHRLTCAIEDAGFEIRDVLMWLFGSGFPKSHDVAKAIDKGAGIWRGRHGEITIAEQSSKGTEYERTDKGEPATPQAAEWRGWGTALKPAYEPIILARKPLDHKCTVAANVLAHGTGAINIEACRVGDTVETWPQSRSYAAGQMQPGGRGDTQLTGDRPQGRWPANIAHDGSDDVLELFPRADSARASGNPNNPRHGSKDRVATSYDWNPERESHDYRDKGSAARFFYCAKANADERAGSRHPTVKPLALKQWLIRLVARKGASILDPFAGTGTTAEAAHREGVNAALIEADPQSQDDIRRRVKLIYAGPEERANAIRVATGQVKPFSETELGRLAA